MKEENIVRYTLEELREMDDLSDWERVENLTDEDIERAVAEDPDAELLDDDWFGRAKLVVPGEKEKVTMRLDREVLDFFREKGHDYKVRIDAVLKAYVQKERRRQHS